MSTEVGDRSGNSTCCQLFLHIVTLILTFQIVFDIRPAETHGDVSRSKIESIDLVGSNPFEVSPLDASFCWHSLKDLIYSFKIIKTQT